jgi:hypothetical protein
LAGGASLKGQSFTYLAVQIPRTTSIVFNDKYNLPAQIDENGLRR